jgi:hypothetical protein
MSLKNLSFKQLPRDLQLSVIKHFDIDTRIKTNIIHKLNIPIDFSIKLNSLNLMRTLSFELRSRQETTHIVTLRISPSKFYVCYFDNAKNSCYWYYVDSTNSATQYGCPYLAMIYPPPSQRMI